MPLRGPAPSPRSKLQNLDSMRVVLAVSCWWEARAILADARGEVWILIGRLGGWVNVGAALKFGKGQVAGEFALFVQHLVTFAVCENAPVAGLMLHRLQGVDFRGAVAREGVVPLWLSGEAIGEVGVAEEERAGEGRCSTRVVEVDVFA